LDDAPFDLAESLYYRHAPVLLARAPSLACESFIARYPQGLSPLRLLPALIKYEETRQEREHIRKAMETTQEQKEVTSQPKQTVVDVQSAATLDGFELRVNEDAHRVGSFEEDPDAVSKYLEGVIKLGCRSSSLFSYLVALYAKLDDEEPLYNFLSIYVPMVGAVHAARKRAVRPGVEQNTPQVPLDMSFALRTVLKSGRHFRSAILLYKGFGMRQEAVELALKVDPSLARELAQESVELDERKRLWLMIAKNAAADPSSRAGKDVVARVVAVLRDCGPDVLSIEDVLPYMPDFASINQIKDEICDALTSYSLKIDQFLKEMSDCEMVCEKLRDDIHRLRSYRMRMSPDARCAYTNKLVLGANEPFYVFPSGFVVLETALKQEVLPLLNDKQRDRVVRIESIMSSKEGTAEVGERDAVQEELDGLLAGECPLTGSVMIDSIDRELEDSIEAWESKPI
jgi:vacuolar protein sorting-associated protein 18